MSIDSSIVPVISMDPPDGKLLYVNPYIGEKAIIDEYGNVKITHGYLRAGWDGVYDSSYPPTYDVKEKADCSKLVYDGSYPLYNISGGILHVNQGHDVNDVKINYIANPPDTYTEPSDLKNTKVDIRKIKPDINSELKKI